MELEFDMAPGSKKFVNFDTNKLTKNQHSLQAEIFIFVI